MTNAFLSGPPFNLDAEAKTWVRSTFEALTPIQRLSQLFVLRSGVDSAAFERIEDFGPGGITAVFGTDPQAELENIASLRAASAVPPLVSADLEGSRMSLPFGAEVPNPLALAAIDDLEATAEISRIMAEEAVAVGINWSFTPVIDINAAFRSAIVATRGFGSDLATIERHALKQIEVFQAAWGRRLRQALAGRRLRRPRPAPRHHHQPPRSRATGRRASAGSTAARSPPASSASCPPTSRFPAFIRSLDPDAGVEAFRPASLSGHLNISPAAPAPRLRRADRVGRHRQWRVCQSWCRRADAIPEVIAGGCDMILFSDDANRDLACAAAGAR